MTFTPSQLEAIESDAPATLIIAGAGSGKTRVVVEKLSRLLESGMSPSEPIVLTFTRKAAAEMKERLVARLTRRPGDAERIERSLRPMMIGTFHSIALRILGTDGDRIGYDRERITVVSPPDAELLLEQVAVDLGYRTDKGWKERLSAKFLNGFLNDCYSNGIVAEFNEHERDRRVVAATMICRDYWARLRRMNSMDFGMILTECRILLEQHPDVLERYRRQYKYVFVDELQDTDAVQYVLHLMFKPTARFVGVGDRRQTIYTFRGARPDLMTEEHPDARIVDLCECFRCGDVIVEAANRLIAHNNDPLAKPMIGATGRPGRITSAPARIETFADDVMKMVFDDGFGLRDIAIIARRHSDLTEIGEALDMAGIPNHHVGHKYRACDTGECRVLTAALRLMLNPRDDLAFMVLRKFVNSIGNTSGLIDSDAAARNIGLAQAWAESRLDHPLASVLLRSWSDESADDDADDSDALPESIEKLARVAAMAVGINSMSAAVSVFYDECRGMSLSDGLRWLSTREGENTQDDVLHGDDRVTLITGHAAKGLEWPAVVIANCNERVFPSARSLSEPTGVMDERRLMYVAMTRAREALFLHWNPDRERSRFIDEACGVASVACV